MSGAPPANLAIRLHLDGELDAGSLERFARTRLAPALAAFLPAQRWFGDKERTIATVAIADVTARSSGGDWYLMTIVDIGFAEGGEARYFIPLAVTDAASSALAILTTPSGERQVAEAFALPAFQTWLLDQLARAADFAAHHGVFHWSTYPALPDRLAAARAGAPRLSQAEQSNTAVIYGDALFCKAFRKLQPGINPDEEIGAFLTTQTGFRQLPLPAATLTYRPASGPPFSLALVQTFVPAIGDGWLFTVDALARGLAEGGDPTAFEPAARRLGDVTGRLHVALAADPTDPAFAPEPITRDDTAQWTNQLLESLVVTRAALERTFATLPPDAQTLVRSFATGTAELARRTDGFGAQVGGMKTRVHGDFHLGQALRTQTADWVLLDFEGEPTRPIAERRAKASPLKDVAGMLRSFAYARGAALRRAPDGVERAALDGWLADWEASARAAFLEGYHAAIAVDGPAPVPSDPAAFAAALAAWELDKALYEVRYELNHRPDWLDLPLGAIVAGGESIALVENQEGGGTGR